jgi:hypothetical protein
LGIKDSASDEALLGNDDVYEYNQDEAGSGTYNASQALDFRGDDDCLEIVDDDDEPVSQERSSTECITANLTGTRADDPRVPATIPRIDLFRRAVSYSVINGSDGFMYIHDPARMSLDQWRNLGVEIESRFSADEIPCVTCTCVCVGDGISWNAWRKVDDRLKCARMDVLVVLCRITRERTTYFYNGYNTL